jgi:hypothetical protein
VITLALAAAAALFSPDLTTPERQARLAPFFSPRPGGSQPIVLDPNELRDFGASRKKLPTRLRGVIQVNPPHGRCLTVTRAADVEDDVVCKPTQLHFVFGDLDKAGTLTWTVVTGDGDYGTTLTWRSPYRTAIVTPFDKDEADPPEYRYVGACDAEKNGEAGRKITLHLLTGEDWILRFPPADTEEPQPDPVPNLLVNISGGKMSIKDAEEQKEAEKANEGGEGEKKPADAAPAPVTKVREKDDRKIWAIPARDAYTMDAAGFLSGGGGGPPGDKGRCRYHYEGPPEDPTTGRVECHDTADFKTVFVPVICLGKIRP